MIKVFTGNERGHIEFTSKELEALLAEAYDEGYEKGRLENYPMPLPHYNPNDVKIRKPDEITYTTTTAPVTKKVGKEEICDVFSKLQKELGL